MRADMFEEDIIKQAVKLAVENDYEKQVINLPKEEEHVFSEEFESKMEDLLNEYSPNLKKKRKTRWRTRFLLVAIVVFAMSSITVFAFPQVREKFIQYCEKLFSDHTEVQFSPPVEKQNQEIEFKLNTPAYIPKGYELMQEYFRDPPGRYTSVYCNGKGKAFYYEQVKPEVLTDYKHSFDSDGSPAKESELNGYPLYWISNGNGVNHLLYVTEDYVYLAGGLVEYGEMYKLLKSVEIE